MSTPNSTVYISNLSYNRDRNGVRSMLVKFGKIQNIKIVVEPTTNQSRGMAFVEMSTLEEAKAAIAGLDQKIIDGRTVKVKFATPNKNAFVQRVPAHLDLVNVKVKAKKTEKDLEYTSVQLAKKARNEAKRKANPLVYKVKAK